MSIIWFAIVVGALSLLQMQFFFFVGLRKVFYRRFFSRSAVYEGEKAEMVEIIENRKIFPILWLRVESKISAYLKFKKQDDLDVRHEKFHQSVFYMRGYKRITRRHEITCTHRGFFQLKNTALTTGDLFGLFNRFKEIKGDAELYVYPQILKNEEIPLESLKWQGDITMRRWIMPDPILINGIREYRHGDSQKDIHWGATARTGELQVKVHDHTVSPRTIIALNAQISETLWGEMRIEDKEVIEVGIRYAAHLATWAVSNGLEVGFCSNAKLNDTKGTVFVHSSCSQAHLEHLLQTMAKLDIVRERNFHSLLDDLYSASTSAMDIVIISSYWSDTLEKRSAKLRSLGNSVTYIPIHKALSDVEEVGDHDQQEAI